MKTIGSLLLLFISSIGLTVIIVLTGIVSAYILEYLGDKIEDFIYKLKEKENEQNKENASQND